MVRAQENEVAYGSGATRRVAELLKFPRKEDEEKKKESEGMGKEGKKEGGRKRKKERKVKGQNGVVYWERRRKCAKRNEGTWSATRKKNTFLGPILNCIKMHLYSFTNFYQQNTGS